MKTAFVPFLLPLGLFTSCSIKESRSEVKSNLESAANTSLSDYLYFSEDERASNRSETFESEILTNMRLNGTPKDYRFQYFHGGRTGKSSVLVVAWDKQTQKPIGALTQTGSAELKIVDSKEKSDFCGTIVSLYNGMRCGGDKITIRCEGSSTEQSQLQTSQSNLCGSQAEASFPEETNNSASNNTSETSSNTENTDTEVTTSDNQNNSDSQNTTPETSNNPEVVDSQSSSEEDKCYIEPKGSNGAWLEDQRWKCIVKAGCGFSKTDGCYSL